MNCKVCGNNIPNNSKFCGVCGWKVEVQNTASVSKSNKAFTISMIIIVVVLCLLLGLSLFGIIPSIGNLGGSKKGVEGSGYKSAEKAVEAYIKALNNGDIDGMLATFAIESYVDNFDTKAHIERNCAFTPRAPFICAYELSDGSDFDRDIRIKDREASIIYNYYNMFSQQTVHHDGQTIGPLEGDDLDEFMKKIKKEDFISDWKDMKFVEMVDPEDVCELFYSEQNQKNLEVQTKAYGCDDIEEVCALVKIGGKKYYQFAQCGMYNDKWYIITCAGNLPALLGMAVDYYGLVPCSEVD